MLEEQLESLEALATLTVQAALAECPLEVEHDKEEHRPHLASQTTDQSTSDNDEEQVSYNTKVGDMILISCFSKFGS